MGRVPCCDKNNGMKKGPWTPEEDLKLTNYIQTHGPGNWRTLPENAGLQRCGKSCRLRWTNYLRPDIKRGRFSFEEEETIIQLHGILGNKWSAIAARLPGRTDNEIKNYWNTHIRKRMLRMGIDPITHAPRLDLLDVSSILRSVLENPSLLNLQALLGNSAQALMNPELLNLAATASLLSIKNNNENLVHTNNNNDNNNNLQQEVIQAGDCHVQNQVATSQGLIGQFQRPTEFSTNLEGLSSQQNYQFGNLIGGEANSVQSLINNGIQNYLGYDSVLSSPNQMNSSSTEEERDSYCGDLFKFEIPESLDISDFL